MVGATKGFKIAHLNTRSLLPKWGELSETILKSNFDVIILTETWLHHNISNSLINNSNYMALRLDRETKTSSGLVKKGGGICIFVRKGITIDISDCVSLSNENIELFHVNIKKDMASKINIIGVYRPPTGNLSAAIDSLDEAVKEIRNKFKGDITCLGDFNVDISKNDKSAQNLATWAANSCLKQLISEPTRVTNRSKSCIDLIFTDIRSVSLSGVIEYSVSDHFPVFLVKKKTRNEKESKTIRCRSFKNFNLESFCEDLREFDFDFNLHVSVDVNHAWDLLWKHIIKICDKHCPFINFNAQAKPDYITDEILSKMRRRDDAFKNAYRSKVPEDLVYAKILRQEVTRELRKAKRQYILSQMDLAQGNSKKFWEIINKNFLTKTDIPMEYVWNDNSGEHIKGEQAAEYINTYFCKISETLAHKFGPLVMHHNEVYSPIPGWEWEANISIADVIKVINEIDVTKASGFSELNSKLLKQ